MNLSQVKLNTNCVVRQVNILDEQTKIRIMELGINASTKIMVKHKSLLKKTLLVVFNSSCFTLKDTIAKNIVVEYV